MTKAFIPLPLAVISMILSACDGKSYSDKNVDEPKVYTSDHKIFYSGYITESGLKKVHAQSNTRISTLVIKSRGGDIVPGMKLGELVFDKKWNVQVQDYCFSSCANYIFPAGNTKYLSKNSQLGWHGGATQPVDEDVIPKDKKGREIFIKTFTELFEVETKFFQKIKVNQLSTVYGIMALNHLNMLKAHDTNCIGWSYSIDALAAFGINNVVLIDGEWDPNPYFNNSCIHLFDKVSLQ